MGCLSAHGGSVSVRARTTPLSRAPLGGCTIKPRRVVPKTPDSQLPTPNSQHSTFCGRVVPRPHVSAICKYLREGVELDAVKCWQFSVGSWVFSALCDLRALQAAERHKRLPPLGHISPIGPIRPISPIPALPPQLTIFRNSAHTARIWSGVCRAEMVTRRRARSFGTVG